MCDHPTLGRSQREGKVYVLFLGESSRAWIQGGRVRRWGEEVDRSKGKIEDGWRRGVVMAEEVVAHHWWAWRMRRGCRD